MSDAIDRMLQNKVSFLADGGPDEDIAISSRIRLARNLAALPFPSASAPEQLDLAAADVRAALNRGKLLGKDAFSFRIGELEEIDRQILFERRLASKELLERGAGSELHVRNDEKIAIMVNEEDHLRIQALSPGFQLEKVWNEITALDSALGRKLDFAFDDKLGYLTACPSNVGTGMRASVMLHLPGLVLAGQMTQVVHGIAKLGLAVRGVYGEGSDNRGNLYQISNQSTLGETEEEIIVRLGKVIREVIAHEKNARDQLLQNNQYAVLDRVGRSYGTLRYGYLLNSEEALNSLSGLRFGVDLGMFSSLDLHTVNELFLQIGPAHLQKMAEKPLNERERDVCRARLVRDRLKKISG